MTWLNQNQMKKKTINLQDRKFLISLQMPLSLIDSLDESRKANGDMCRSAWVRIAIIEKLKSEESKK